MGYGMCPYVSGLVESFGLKPGMTVVDYGCGPGRYTVDMARLSGQEGKTIAVDLSERALRVAEKRVSDMGLDLDSVVFKLARGYNTGLPDGTADMVCAIDVFHMVNSELFSEESFRITNPKGRLVISGGHQSRNSTKREIAESGLWELEEETGYFMKFRKIRL